MNPLLLRQDAFLFQVEVSAILTFVLLFVLVGLEDLVHGGACNLRHDFKETAIQLKFALQQGSFANNRVFFLALLLVLALMF